MGRTGGVRSAEADLFQSCDPNNQYAEQTGPAFKASGSGSGRFWESELEHPDYVGRGVDPTDYVGGKIVWSFSMVATEDVGGGSYPGNFFGSLIAKITWDNGQVTTFHSRCLAEGEIDGGTIREASLEAEGEVIGFSFDTTRRPATATLKMRRNIDTRKVAVKFALHLGDHCASSDAEFALGANSIDEQGESPGEDGLGGRRESGEANGVMKSPNSHVGVDTGGCTEDETEGA